MVNSKYSLQQTDKQQNNLTHVILEYGDEK